MKQTNKQTKADNSLYRLHRVYHASDLFVLNHLNTELQSRKALCVTVHWAAAQVLVCLLGDCS